MTRPHLDPHQQATHERADDVFIRAVMHTKILQDGNSVAVYGGFQPSAPQHGPGLHLFKLTRDVAEKRKGAMVTASTLESLGYSCPHIPEIHRHL